MSRGLGWGRTVLARVIPAILRRARSEKLLSAWARLPASPLKRPIGEGRSGIFREELAEAELH
jgi:hypothetical protein